MSAAKHCGTDESWFPPRLRQVSCGRVGSHTVRTRGSEAARDGAYRGKVNDAEWERLQMVVPEGQGFQTLQLAHGGRKGPEATVI